MGSLRAVSVILGNVIYTELCLIYELAEGLTCIITLVQNFYFLCYPSLLMIQNLSLSLLLISLAPQCQLMLYVGGRNKH